MTVEPSLRVPAIPASAWRLIVLEFWERFSYYGILAILVLFLTSPTARGGFGWSNSQALDLLSMFAAIAFMLPMLGGYVADRWMGTRRAVFIGTCLLVAGNVAIALSALFISSVHATWILYVGLAGVALGNGFFKSSLVTLLGSLIVGDDAARDRAFRYYYQAIMTGALAASLCVGKLADVVGWWSGFALAAVGMAIAFAIFVIWPPPAPTVMSGPLADSGATTAIDATIETTPTRAVLDVAILCLFLIVITVGWVQFQGVWLLEMESGVDRMIGSFTVPAAWLLSVNAIVVVLFTPASGRLWRRLIGSGGSGDSSRFTTQFAAAFALMGIAHLLMALGFRGETPGGVSMSTPGGVSMSTPAGVSMLWPVGCVLLITIGELIFWPSSYNAIHRIAPARSKSFLMGIWLATLGVGQYVTHQVGRTVDAIGFAALSGYVGAAMLIACVAVLVITRMRPTLRTL